VSTVASPHMDMPAASFTISYGHVAGFEEFSVTPPLSPLCWLPTCHLALGRWKHSNCLGIVQIYKIHGHYTTVIGCNLKRGSHSNDIIKIQDFFMTFSVPFRDLFY